MTTPPAARSLPCGRDPLDVVDRARAGRADAHELDCPHCQAAIAAAEPIGRAALELAEGDSAIAAPASLLPNIMRGVWSELRQATDIPLNTPTGTTFVTDRAVTSLLQAALDNLAHFTVHTCRVVLESPDADGENSADQLAVRVTAAIAYRADLAALAEQARGLIAELLHAQFGLTADSIDIDIIDVFVGEGTLS